MVVFYHSNCYGKQTALNLELGPQVRHSPPSLAMAKLIITLHGLGNGRGLEMISLLHRHDIVQCDTCMSSAHWYLQHSHCQHCRFNCNVTKKF